MTTGCKSIASSTFAVNLPKSLMNNIDLDQLKQNTSKVVVLCSNILDLDHKFHKVDLHLNLILRKSARQERGVLSDK